MRRLIYVISTLMSFVSISYAQVDTLQLVEIGNIQAQSEITNLYTEDLDNDNLKEIILTTVDYIYLYNSGSLEPIWTSPQLDHPRDLIFSDINNDGFMDISERDSTNIRLLDFHNDEIIWTSPELDSTYKCYAVGDRNNDDFLDIVIVSKEPFTREMVIDNRDTVWVDIFDGPFLQESGTITLLMLNFQIASGPIFYWEYFETPNDVAIESISRNGGNSENIFVFTAISTYSLAPGNIQTAGNTGQIWCIDADTGNLDYTHEGGGTSCHTLVESDGSTYLCCFSSSYSMGPYFEIYQYSKSIDLYSSDSLLNSSVIWETSVEDESVWNGYAIDEFALDNPNMEIGFSSHDSLYLYGLLSGEVIWNSSGILVDAVVASAFNDTYYFENPQVICQTGGPSFKYEFFDGSDGLQTAVITDFAYPISKIDDLNLDSSDEILSLDGTSLRILEIQRTGVDDEIPVPLKAFLSANYPNPFNASTTIEYSLPETGEVSIEIFDLLGRRVETLLDGRQDAGVHAITWNAENKASGVYFYRLKTEENSQTRRMVLLK